MKAIARRTDLPDSESAKSYLGPAEPSENRKEKVGMSYIDPVKVSPDHYKLLLENDNVRVLEMKVKAGDKDVKHSHLSETAYFITGSKVRHLPNGNSQDVEIPDGHVMWHEPWTHAVENVGSKDIHAIIVESKK